MGLTATQRLERLLEGPVLDAAHALLGLRLHSEIDGIPVEIAINEVEAYGGGDDPASHAYRGRTPRNGSMFAPPGTAYVYRSYGVHWCLNVSTGPEGTATAVLLRGGVVTEGRATVERRRSRTDSLADGPGKLCQALGVTGDHDGVNLLDGEIRLLPGAALEGTVIATPRVGISKAKELPWRLVIAQQIG